MYSTSSLCQFQLLAFKILFFKCQTGQNINIFTLWQFWHITLFRLCSAANTGARKILNDSIFWINLNGVLPQRYFNPLKSGANPYNTYKISFYLQDNIHLCYVHHSTQCLFWGVNEAYKLTPFFELWTRKCKSIVYINNCAVKRLY